MDTDSPRLRLSILAVVVLSLFGALFARLWYLQVMVGRPLPGRGVGQPRAHGGRGGAPRPHPRRQGPGHRRQPDVAAWSRSTPTSSSKLHEGRPRRPRAAGGRAAHRGRHPHQGDGHREAPRRPAVQPQLQPIPVAIDVPEDLLLYFSERADEFPSVAVERESVREYHYGRVAGPRARLRRAHLAETSSTPSRARHRPEAASPSPTSPTAPSARPASRRRTRTTSGARPASRPSRSTPRAAVRTVSEQAPQPGNDIQLTIDIDVQHHGRGRRWPSSSTALRGGRQEDGNRHVTKAPAGSVVTLDPNNGNVIAMASYPTYDPDEFVNGIRQERYAPAAGRRRQKRPVLEPRHPGPVRAGLHVQAGHRHRRAAERDHHGNTRTRHGHLHDIGCGARRRGASGSARTPAARNGSIVDGQGAHRVDRRVLLLARRPLLARRARSNGIQDTARAFGLGADTASRSRASTPASCPTPRRQEGVHEKNPEAYPDDGWYTGDNVNSAIGQGDVLVTPLQLADAYATFANGGTVYQPQVVPEVLNGSSGRPAANPADVVRIVDPVVTGTVDLPRQRLRPDRRRVSQGVTTLGRARPPPSRASTRPTSRSSARPAPPRSTARPTPRSSPPTRRSALPATRWRRCSRSPASAPRPPHRWCATSSRLLAARPQSAVTSGRRGQRTDAALARSPGTTGPDRSRRDPSAPWRHLDPVLLVCTLASRLIGVVMVYSATRGPRSRLRRLATSSVSSSPSS